MNTIENKYKKIAIVGFGGAGLSFFVQIIDAYILAGQSVAIDIFEKGNIATGLAYSTPFSSHILNLDIHTMSVSHTKPNHFYTWLVANKESWTPNYPDITLETMFPPRNLFGEYLQATFEEYCVLAKTHDIQLTIHRTEVVDIVSMAINNFVLTDSKHREHLSEIVILAVGNQSSDTYKDLIGIEGYYPTPWEDVIIRNEKPIAVIGTRLTAIDTVLNLLAEKKIQNKVLMVSRSGRLPKIIGPSSSYVLNELSEQGIRDNIDNDGHIPLMTLWGLFKGEIERAEGNPVDWMTVLNGKESDLADLSEEISLVENKVQRPWQSVLIAFYPLVPWCWSLLSDTDKVRLVKDYFSIWLTYLAAFPLQNAIRIHDYLQGGLLEIHGGLKSIEPSGVNEFNLYGIQSETFKVGTVINATGAGHSFAQSKLLSALSQKKIIGRSAAGGIHIDPKSCIIIPRDGLRRYMYAIGEMAFGDWLATADMGQVSRQASLVVNDIIT